MIPRSAAAARGQNSAFNLLPAVGGLNAAASLMAMPKKDAVILENFFPFPDRLQQREGYTSHVTGLASPAYRMHVYSGSTGTEKLYATTDSGVYDVSTAGAVGAAAIALTNGKTSGAMLSTGAAHYLMLVNGTDSLVQYNGTAWSSVATLGVVNTNTLSAVEVYRQRLYFAKKNSLTFYFLPANSVSGTMTSYELGAIFRQGGYIVAMGTWTLDSGSGPDDQLAIVSSKGEIAVFSGSDPSSSSTWAFRGVYYIGKPLGSNPLYKYGGDLLFLGENGLYPLSQTVQSAAIERTRSVTDKIRQLFNDAAVEFSANEGWQIIAQPNIPMLLVNVPASPQRKQFVMHAQTGAWATYVGWDAYAFARMGSDIYFSTATTIMKVGGVADDGANITSTAVQAYSNFNTPKTKQITALKTYFTTGGNFTYNLGLISDFGTLTEASSISRNLFSTAALWGSAIWGAAVWGGSDSELQEWQTVPDIHSVHKALYLQIVSNVGSVSYYGCDGLFIPGGNFG